MGSCVFRACTGMGKMAYAAPVPPSFPLIYLSKSVSL